MTSGSLGVARRACSALRRLRPGLVGMLCLGLWAGAPALAADPMRICLNWAPGADHAPLYLARSQGWYADANLAVELRPGGGSADALAKLASEDCEAAIADFAAVGAARAAGVPVMAVFAVFADSPLAFYAPGTVRLAGFSDLAGKRIAADSKETARRRWPELARRAGIDPAVVRWVDVPNNAKVQALARGEADVAANTFYHHHAEFVAAFGAPLQVLWWRDAGLNPLGNVVAVREQWLAVDPARARLFVGILQRAHRDCLLDAAQCLAALLRANPHLDAEGEAAKWQAAALLMAPARRRGRPLGGFDPELRGADTDAAGRVFTEDYLSEDLPSP